MDQQTSTEIRQLEQKGILLAKSHLTIVAIALAIILGLGYLAFTIFVDGIRREAEFKQTLALKGKENEQLQKDQAAAEKAAAQQIAALEKQRAATKTQQQAAAVLSSSLPATPSDPTPVEVKQVPAPTAENPDATKTVTQLSTDATKRAADGVLVAQENVVKLNACTTDLSKETQIAVNTQQELDSCKRVRKPGFFRRFGQALKVAIPAAIAGAIAGRILIK